ncbi:MAG: ABC-2 family transporter protein [Termitinemataceae bacterium]
MNPQSRRIAPTIGARILRFFRLYWIFTIQFIKRLMEYRADFITGALAFFIGQFFNLVFIFIIFRNIPMLDGWTVDQIVFIYGFSLIPRGLDHFYADNLWKVAYFLIRRGEFDKYLTRPIDPLHHVLLEGFEVDALGELISGIVLVVIATNRLGLSFTLLQIGGGLVAVLFGTLIYTGIKIIFAAIALWTKQSGSLLHMVYMTSDFAKYPITIYNLLVKTVVTYILPFAFTAYYPAAWLLTGEGTFFALSGTIIAGSSLIILGRLIWNRGLHAYESAGS